MSKDKIKYWKIESSSSFKTWYTMAHWSSYKELRDSSFCGDTRIFELIDQRVEVE